MLTSIGGWVPLAMAAMRVWWICQTNVDSILCLSLVQHDCVQTIGHRPSFGLSQRIFALFSHYMCFMQYRARTETLPIFLFSFILSLNEYIRERASKRAQPYTQTLFKLVVFHFILHPFASRIYETLIQYTRHANARVTQYLHNYCFKCKTLTCFFRFLFSLELWLVYELCFIFADYVSEYNACLGRRMGIKRVTLRLNTYINVCANEANERRKDK